MTVDLVACTASAWQGESGRCHWCNAELTGRRTAWCSDACAAEFGRNHWWTSASRAARRRDDSRCVECARDPRDVYAEKIAAGWTERDARRFLTLQVHHRIPVLGRHGETGCHHHLDGLETVCLWHHLERHHGASHGEQLALGDAA